MVSFCEVRRVAHRICKVSFFAPCGVISPLRLCPPSMEQKGALAAYRMGREYFSPIRDEYQRRRDVLYEGLKDVPGIIMHKPEGAFYISVKLPLEDSEHFVRWMLTDFRLDNRTVMVAPAQGFYSTPGKGKDEIRIAYVLNEEDLKQAIIVFKEGLREYRMKKENTE